jgi:hypothetical protein
LRSLARNVAEEGAEVSAILKCRTHTKGLAAHARLRPAAAPHRSYPDFSVMSS